MNSRDIIQKSVDYIEANLKTHITPQELCDIASFSLFHYYRMFQEELGMPVMQYILRRRLVNAIYEISGGKKMIDAALDYGFDTHAGFFKAFRREYGMSPSCYLKRHKPAKPYKINLKEEITLMLSNKQIVEVLGKWGMEKETVSPFYYESSGVKSDSSWYIGENYILKAGSNLKALKRHINIAGAVYEAGIETTVPVPTSDGRDYILDGETYFWLTTRPKGKCVLAGGMYGGNGAETTLKIGSMLGRLHKVLKERDSDIVCGEGNLYENISGAAEKVKEFMSFPEEFYTDLTETLGRLCPSLPMQVIHRNPTPSDFVFRNGEPVGFIEFEMAERNVRIFDLCYAATAILSESFDAKDSAKLDTWLTIYISIFAGYDREAHLTDDEKAAAPYVVLAIELQCAAYFSGADKFKNLSETTNSMLKWLAANKDKLTIE